MARRLYENELDGKQGMENIEGINPRFLSPPNLQLDADEIGSPLIPTHNLDLLTRQMMDDLSHEFGNNPSLINNGEELPPKSVLQQARQGCYVMPIQDKSDRLDLNMYGGGTCIVSRQNSPPLMRFLKNWYLRESVCHDPDSDKSRKCWANLQSKMNEIGFNVRDIREGLNQQRRGGNAFVPSLRITDTISRVLSRFPKDVLNPKCLGEGLYWVLIGFRQLEGVLITIQLVPYVCIRQRSMVIQNILE